MRAGSYFKIIDRAFFCFDQTFENVFLEKETIVRNKKGFTLVRLLRLVVALVFLGFQFIILPRANIWYTYSGILTEIKFENPEAQEIISADKNWLSYSKITVRNKDGSDSAYDLDTCILFSYRVIPIGDDKEG